MVLKELKLRSFRNISELNLACDPQINVICGKNGQPLSIEEISRQVIKASGEE